MIGNRQSRKDPPRAKYTFHVLIICKAGWKKNSWVPEGQLVGGEGSQEEGWCSWEINLCRILFGLQRQVGKLGVGILSCWRQNYNTKNNDGNHKILTVFCDTTKR